MRYTEKQLKADIDRYNGYLEEFGIDRRFRWGHRNDYNAVDLYDGSGACLRNTETGSPRECNASMGNAYRELRRQHEVEKQIAMDKRNADLMKEAADCIGELVTLDHPNCDDYLNLMARLRKGSYEG